MKTVSIELLRSTFSYDPSTGIIIRLKDNTVMNQVGSRGYFIVNWNKKIWKIHRIAWALFYGEWPTTDIDHCDRNKQNNSINNLRLVTRSVNVFNGNTRSDNRSGQRGVCFDANRNKWLARRGTVFIGRYGTIEEATEAYRRDVELYHNVTKPQ